MVHTVESRFSKLFGQELKLNRVLTIVLTVGQQRKLYFKIFHFLVTKSGLCCISVYSKPRYILVSEMYCETFSTSI